MTYRSDLEALEAREATLSHDIEVKRRERDAVAQLIAETRRAQAAAHERERRLARASKLRITLVIAGVAMLASAGTIALAQPSRPVAEAPSMRFPVESHPYVRPTLSCAEAVQKGESAYIAALASAGMVRARLQPFHGEIANNAQAWQPVAVRHQGKRRIALPGDSEVYGAVWWDKAGDLVRDDNGDIWYAIRVPGVDAFAPYDVTPCAETCIPASGMRTDPSELKFLRSVWLLPEGARYRGTLQVPYRAPKITIERPDCPPAP